MNRIDHLVYATPDLSQGVEEIEALLGVRASAGGPHPGWGTRNALIALGSTNYLEIIAPDPKQPPPRKPRPFGIDRLAESTLVTWAARSTNLEALAREAGRGGVRLGAVLSGSRLLPDGIELSWRLTDPWTVVADGIVPFFIDWGESHHPAGVAAPGASLVELRAEHPKWDRVQAMLHTLGLDLSVGEGSQPALIAVVRGPRGDVELRSG
ncbi:MAG TPA: VOC family protein [Candidatus Limnocylindria bacterium]|nr:VOC family protein [Candidatus Limnocylindria bacterium]